MSNPDRMILQGAYLRINLPDMFEDPNFLDYLNDSGNTMATWHVRHNEPTEYSDCFMQYDNGEGSNSDLPSDWWVIIDAICVSEGFKHGILHITNL